MRKKIFSLYMIFVLALISVLQNISVYGSDNTESVDYSYLNIGVDLNGTENRTQLRYEGFENWVINECQSASYEVDGIKFTLSNETGDGVIKTGQNKFLYDAENKPLLTLDGLILEKTFKGGVIKLQIDGLPSGTHTLTTWHSFFNYSSNATISTMTVNVNGEDVVSNASIPCKVESDDDAYIMYTEFEAVEGESVVILFKADGNGSLYDIPILNAFEINGVHPLKDIMNPQPENGDTHFQSDKGLNWQAAIDAVAHRVYLGTDEFTVLSATTGSDEYMGEFSECNYDFSNLELDHMKTYYWRVDEVFSDGSVVKGVVNSFKPAHLAFPSAEGYGRFANGGRGGIVVEVTTLEDGYTIEKDEAGNEVEVPIEGSLRWAIESFTEPRIIVFKVGGVIELDDRLYIDSEHDNVYIAGQTAPGDGITLIKNTFGALGAEDVIIRNIRVRVGDANDTSSSGISLVGSDNCIVDHCSISWATDENFSSRGSSNITLQRSILAEGLSHSYHYDLDEWSEVRSYAASIGGDIGSYHHNLLINNAARCWNMAGGVADNDIEYGGNLDIRNNVVYNWYDEATTGNANKVNFVGNYHKMGPASVSKNIFAINEDVLIYSDIQEAYLSGNKLVDTENNVLLDPLNDDPWKYATATDIFNKIVNPDASKSSTAFYESYITEHTADEAYESVSSDVGAVVPSLDYIDKRYINEVSSGTYTYAGSKYNLAGIIDSQDDAEGYPDMESFKGAEAPTDSDHDGMPDEWEILHGLDPNNYYDACQIYLSDEGYTNIELYVNELAGDEVSYSDNPVLIYPSTEEPTETPTVTEIPAQQINWELLGDIDKNGANDAFDSLSILKHASKLELLKSNIIYIADITQDGVIDAEDALEVLKIAAKIEVEKQYSEISIGDRYIVNKIEVHGGTPYIWVHELYPENGLILSIDSKSKNPVSDEPVDGGLYENTYIIQADQIGLYQLKMRLSNERWADNPKILKEMVYFICVK